MSTPDTTDVTTSLSRRLLSRGAAAALSALAVGSPGLVDRAGAVPLTERMQTREVGNKGKHGRHWHRCPVHRRHTCNRKNRCRHRRHHRAKKPRKPAPQPPGTPTPATPPTSTPEAHGLTDADLHLVRRFTYGYTPELGASVVDAGGAAAWFAQQLEPASIPDDAADDIDTWWPSLALDATTLWQRDQAQTEPLWVAMQNYARWCLMRRVHSRRQVFEVMVELWENHLHIPLFDDGVGVYRADYGRAIRAHALGRYDDLLVAAITHPAMAISLDNANSTKAAPNENLGRELLELHTVGKGNHAEDDVKSSARILTGYRVDMWRTWAASYAPTAHWTGPVTVLDFHHDNGAPDGRPVVEAYLRYLARHPRTAERIARKLAVRFVSDQPSAELVGSLAEVYLAHDTAIVPVLRALVDTPEFRSSAGQKVRTPTDDVVATHRALGTRIARPTTAEAAANSILWQASAIGQSPFEWGRPDGPPDAGAAWSSASRVLASFEQHFACAGGWWPSEGITYRTAASWLPQPSLRFDALVDHLCRQLFGRSASPSLLAACGTVVDIASDATITADHRLIRWQLPAVLATLLDSPEHLHR